MDLTLDQRDKIKSQLDQLRPDQQREIVRSLVEDRPRLIGTYKPREYQKLDIDFLHQVKRGAIWHEPGLGKTLIASDASVLPATISVPTYLVEQWYDWLKFQYPGHKVVNAYCDRDGSPLDHYSRCKALEEPADWHIIIHEMMRPETIEIVHPNGQVTKDIKKDNQGNPVYHYPLPPALTFVIDEAHRLRGRTAKQSRGALDLTKPVPFVYELTGSPIFRVVDDLFMQLRILDDISFASYERFVNMYCKTEMRGWSSKVTGARNLKSLLAATSKWARLRTYSELASQGVILPDVIPPNGRKVRVPMTRETARRYQMVQDYLNPDDVLEPYMYATQVLLKLRRETAKAREKLDALSEVLDDVRNAPDGTKRGVVIFTWFRDTAEAIGKHTGAKVIHGDMVPTERRRVAKSSALIVANLAALSEGVDLSHCRVVIFYEEDYSPGYEFQALRRVLRASDDQSPILLVYIHLKDTVDEVVHFASVNRINDARTVLKMVEMHTKEVSERAFG